MKVANDWKDYEILDMANGEKLERWGNIFLVRPDPQIIWVEKSFKEKWKNVHGIYNRSKTGGGSWNFKKKVPESWQIKYKNLTFNIKPTFWNFLFKIPIFRHLFCFYCIFRVHFSIFL